MASRKKQPTRRWEKFRNGKNKKMAEKVIFFCFEKVDATIPEKLFQSFCKQTKTILKKKTWTTRLLSSGRKVPICLKFGTQSPFMILSLVNDSYMRTEACPDIPGEAETKVPLSCTAWGETPKRIYIHATNWERGYFFALCNDGFQLQWNSQTHSFPDFTPPYTFQYFLDTYRSYIINHEVGHALGRDHYIPHENDESLAPVMMQQTKRLYSYTPNGTPLPFE
jgi:hypothetical protein